MTDEGAQRREARQFEPPPWEREQFVELLKRRVEEEQVDVEEHDAGDEEVERLAVPPDALAVTPVGGAETPQAVDVETAQTAGAQGAGVEQRELDTMMFELKAQEPSPGRVAWQLGAAVAVFLALLGTALMLWGMVGLVKVLRTSVENRSAGMLVAGTLLFFGAGFVGLAGGLG
ncbi:MAG: hypothetical protein OEV43_06620, partial [Coriobacteriia bacterium]|nr:hypothetical protein [Coriobacteriia bacterium]